MNWYDLGKRLHVYVYAGVHVVSFRNVSIRVCKKAWMQVMNWSALEICSCMYMCRQMCSWKVRGTDNHPVPVTVRFIYVYTYIHSHIYAPGERFPQGTDGWVMHRDIYLSWHRCRQDRKMVIMHACICSSLARIYSCVCVCVWWHFFLSRPKNDPKITPRWYLLWACICFSLYRTCFCGCVPVCLCMYVCMYLFIYVCFYLSVCMHVCMYIYVQIISNLCVHMYHCTILTLHVCVCIHVYMYVCYTNVCDFTRILAWQCLHTCLSISHTHTHTFTRACLLSHRYGTKYSTEPVGDRLKQWSSPPRIPYLKVRSNGQARPAFLIWR
jgi:hypothetical protein